MSDDVEPVPAPTDTEPVRRHRWRDWRWVLSNLLILVGVLVLLYPVSTWVYAWWQQRSLEQELVATHPMMAQPAAEVFVADMVPTGVDRTIFRTQEEKDKQVVEVESLRRAAARFASEFLQGDGSGGVPIGRVIIPKIGVDTVLVEGTGRADLREGPGHWPETPLPGMGGNFVVSGHRTTYGGPFFKLDKLKPGDRIDLLLPYAAASYRVTRTVVVLPSQTDVVAQRGKEELSLATCHPIYSARQRLVVQAEMVSFKVREEKAPAGTSTGVAPGGSG